MAASAQLLLSALSKRVPGQSSGPAPAPFSGPLTSEPTARGTAGGPEPLHT